YIISTNPIRYNNNNISIVVGTQQGQIVQRLPLKDIPIQQNIQNSSTSVSTPVVYNKNGSVRKPVRNKYKNMSLKSSNYKTILSFLMLNQWLI
ncbi:hypothetical protein BpHYR1_008082, partial [Brachionus plicatilis]